MSTVSIVGLLSVDHRRVDQRKKDDRHFRIPPTMAAWNFPLNRRTRHFERPRYSERRVCEDLGGFRVLRRSHVMYCYWCLPRPLA
jgi:hypothetical protein